MQKKRFPEALKDWSFPLLAIVFLIAFYHSTISNRLKHLQAVTDMSGDRISELLIQGDFNGVNRTLQTIVDTNSLDGAVLLGESGDYLDGAGQIAADTSFSLEIGGRVGLALPSFLNYQYAAPIPSNERPLAYLLLSSRTNIFIYLCFTLVFAAMLGWRFVRLGQSQTILSRIERNPGYTQDSSSTGSGAGEIREQISQLEQERDAALTTVRAKGDFLAHVSHEIRTSLNGIMGVLSLVKTSGLAGEKKRLVDAAENSAHSLLFIIDDILDFSKITSGKIEFESIRFNLREVIEDCLALYKDAARAKKVALHSYMPLDINPEVVGDPTRLRQILTNLLSNAVKFTNKGDVGLRVSLIEQAEKKQHLRFAVEDTGIGIAQEKLDGIFDMFAQANENTARKYGGTGLGLSVCKNLIELQNGEIGVKSRPGHGTLFWFSLELPTIPQVDVVNTANELGGKEIVLFDNCETCRTILHQYLPECKIHNATAEDIEEVLEKLGQIKSGSEKIPDSILIDYSCTSKRVDLLIEELGALFPANTPACFVLLQNSNREQQLIASGVTGVVHKPIRLEQLYGELSGSIMHETAEKISDGTDSLQGKVLLVDDEIINQHVGEMILRRLGLEVDLASSGNEALEKIRERKYDLVLMDIQMPDMSGIETAEKIRAREQEKGREPLAIIAVTANALGTMKQRSLDAGMNGFIVKPIQPDLLYEYLAPWLTCRAPAENSDNAVIEVAAEDEIPDDDDPVIWDRTQALQYLGGDEDLLQDLMKLFINRKGKLLAAIEDAMKTTDGEAISCAAHAFKGAVNHFAAKKCQRLALTIEYKAGEGGLEGLDTYLNELRVAADTLEEELKQQVIL